MKIINSINAYFTGRTLGTGDKKKIGEFTIKQEINEYSSQLLLYFLNSTNEQIDLFDFMEDKTKFLSTVVFSLEELVLLSEKFDFSLNNINSKSNCEAHLELNPLYGIGQIGYLEHKGIEYIVIYFLRWQHDFQPRGAGEDQLGEDITYIHGIWEDVDLPESIINKIKGK